VSITTTNTLNGHLSLPKEQKPAKSPLVLISLIFICAAFVLVPISAIFALPYLAALAVVNALTAITFAVLSLRERA
jgi:hypothetical protein